LVLLHYRTVRSLNGFRASFQACGTVYITHNPWPIVRAQARNNPSQLAPNTKQLSRLQLATCYEQ